jgi:hypothetical protein
MVLRDRQPLFSRRVLRSRFPIFGILPLLPRNHVCILLFRFKILLFSFFQARLPLNVSFRRALVARQQIVFYNSKKLLEWHHLVARTVNIELLHVRRDIFFTR